MRRECLGIGISYARTGQTDSTYSAAQINKCERGTTLNRLVTDGPSNSALQSP